LIEAPTFMLGELHPVGGGDPIPLLKQFLTVGRRESSDIVLRFPNVSGSHCELELVDGYWHVRDLDSRNGTKVNGERVKKHRLDPNDKLSVARHVFEIHYDPTAVGATKPAWESADHADIFAKSLLEAAGLESRPRKDQASRHPPR
jgi:pSer/pThr/pTyr-binding forkhead associated (FHA) protein